MKLFDQIKQRFASKCPEKDRVPVGEKAAYGIGNSVEALTVWLPLSVITPVFNIGLGMSPALIGIVLGIWRIWDAIADPIMGNISDNTRTRWGRRRPFIVVGAIATGLIFPIMWWAPIGSSDTFLFCWLMFSGFLLFSAFTVWAMPYYSLQLEMTPDYNERTNVSAYRSFFGSIFNLVGGWLLAIASMDVFADASGEPDLVNGMRFVCFIMAALIITIGVLPGIFVKERYYDAEAARQEPQKLLPSLKRTLSTRPFLILVLIAVTQILGMGLVGTLGFYLNLYYVCEGDLALAAKFQGVINTALFLPSLLAIPFCVWFSAKYGKRKLLYLITAMSISGFLATYIFYIPGKPWLMLIPALLKGTIATGLWMIVPSMQADIADHDELTSHARREGSFCSVFSWTTKVAWTVNMSLSGFILVATGFNVEREGGQPEAVLNNMLHVYIWVPITVLCISLFAINRYGLTRGKVAEIRQQLEARRGSIGNEEQSA